MQEAGLEEIERTARKLAKSESAWHFHILTPVCTFNVKPQYAFILEDISHNKVYVNYSGHAEKELGQKLITLLHGNKVLGNKIPEKYNPTEQSQKIIKRIREINARGTEWHHHVLFPSCTFNKNKSKYTLVLEDQENNETLESVSDGEPKNDLKQIEGLFYGIT